MMREASIRLTEADALRAALPLDLRAIRERLEAEGGGVRIVHASAALELRIEVLVSPGPGTLRVERGDAVYLVLDGQGLLGSEEGEPLDLIAGEAVVVPAGVRHVLYADPRLSLLVTTAPGWRPVAPLAVCRPS